MLDGKYVFEARVKNEWFTVPFGAPVIRGILRKPELHGTLCMGVNKKAYSFSFCSRTLPMAVSEDTEKALHRDAPYTTVLTVAELRNKATKLMLLAHPEAMKAHQHLVDFIKDLPVQKTVDEKNQRLLLWFD